MNYPADDMSKWLQFVQPTYKVKFNFITPIILAGKSEAQSSAIGVIVNHMTEQKQFSILNATYQYEAIREWKFVEKFDLWQYNNEMTPEERVKVETTVPHSKVESIEFVPNVITVKNS